MEEKKTVQLKPWHGILGFVIIMVIFTLVAYPIQSKLGLIGVGITELILLALAIGAALLTKQNLKEVFPIHLPQGRQILGTLIMWVGNYLLVMVVSSLLLVIAPEQMTATSEGLNSVISSKGLLLGILIVSLSPAICEEAVHRGFILHTFKNVKHEWITVLVMGIIFGVFHLDPVRFLPTAVLGAALSFIMVKTGNMVLPALFHAVNNLVPLLLSFGLNAFAKLAEEFVKESGMAGDAMSEALEQASNITPEQAVVSLGSCLFTAAIAPFILVAGARLLMKKEDAANKPLNKKAFAIALIIGAVMAVAGIALIAMNYEYILEMSGVSLEDLGL